MPIDVDTVLVPLDGSDAALEAIEYGLAIADRYGADLHILYVFGETVARGLESGDVEEVELRKESEAVLADVQAMAPDGVAIDSSIALGFTRTRKTVHPGSVILDQAEQLDADFLVVPRETMGRGQDTVLEKAAEYVLLYASQPVLSV
ncbi:MAG: universal stress protein [Halodesulfurarchaeum sp.]